jgi:hypothetical protein
VARKKGLGFGPGFGVWNGADEAAAADRACEFVLISFGHHVSLSCLPPGETLMRDPETLGRLIATLADLRRREVATQIEFNKLQTRITEGQIARRDAERSISKWMGSEIDLAYDFPSVAI